MKRGQWIHREIRKNVREIEQLGAHVQAVGVDQRDMEALHDAFHPCDEPGPLEWREGRKAQRRLVVYPLP